MELFTDYLKQAFGTVTMQEFVQTPLAHPVLIYTVGPDKKGSIDKSKTFMGTVPFRTLRIPEMKVMEIAEKNMDENVYNLTGALFSAGRAPINKIHINGETVSTLHAYFYLNNKDTELMDSSSNGTFFTENETSQTGISCPPKAARQRITVPDGVYICLGPIHNNRAARLFYANDSATLCSFVERKLAQSDTTIENLVRT